MRKYNILFVEHVSYDVWDQQCFCCYKFTVTDVIDLFVLIIHEQKVSLARRFALVPLGPPLLTYKSNCKAMLTAEGDSVRLVVDRPYKAGEPIIVWYYVLFSCIKFVFFLMLFCNLNSCRFCAFWYIFSRTSNYVDYTGVDHKQTPGWFWTMVLLMKTIPLIA